MTMSLHLLISRLTNHRQKSLKGRLEVYWRNLQARLEHYLALYFYHFASLYDRDFSKLQPSISPKGSKRIRFACVREYVFPRKQSFCTLPSTGGCALGMGTTHQQQLTLPLPQHRERLHSKRRKKIRHWRRKQRKMSEGITATVNASDLSTSDDSDSGSCVNNFSILMY